jgi:hypothetical protein
LTASEQDDYRYSEFYKTAKLTILLKRSAHFPFRAGQMRSGKMPEHKRGL